MSDCCNSAAGMKQGTNSTLKVRFNTIDVETVDRIEFIFTRSNAASATPVKTNVYPDDVALHDGIFLVPWTADEKRAIKPDETFYMDTRITYVDSDDQPMTNIVKLKMNHTLFD